MKKKLKTILSMALAVAMFTAFMPAMSFDVFADDEAKPVVTSWVDLYTGMGLSGVEAGAGKYDAVTTATKIAPNVHVRHIPNVVNKAVVSADETGNVKEYALDGVVLSGKEATVTPALQSAYWETSRTKGENKQYGTDELVVIPDDTVEGYTWNEYLANIYAVTVSDGTTTVGALPWVDFYGEQATSGPHYNKVEIALNNSKTGVPVSGDRHGEVIYRFDPFYTNEVLNAGIYTVTVYAEGFVPLNAEIKVPVYTDAKVTVSDANAASANVAFEGLPEDYGVICKVDDNEATLDGSTLSYDAVLPGNHTLTVSDRSGKYNDFTASFVVMADAAAAAFDGTKIVKAEGASEELFAAYLAGITSVNVNGKEYRASGRGSVKVIQADGSIDLSKTDAAGVTAPVAVVVSSTGYSDLEFEMYTGEAAEAIAAANTAKSAAAKINATDYTAASYKAVAAAVKALNEAIANNDTEAIKAATATLNAAVSSAKAKSNATIKVSPLKKTYKVKKLKKKAKTFQLKAAVSSGAKATFVKVSGNKKITVSNTGKVTVKKKLKRGTYKVRIKVAAPATANSKAASTTVTVVVKVKK